MSIGIVMILFCSCAKAFPTHVTTSYLTQAVSKQQMEWLFGHKKTPEELLKENQRLLKKSMRDLDRERTHLEQQENKVIADIKKSAKAGQLEATRVMAKDLVRTRRYIKKMIMMKTQIQAVSLKIQTLKSQNSMAQAMRGVTKAMTRMNKAMNMPALQQIMMEFQKQSEIMDMKQEVMDDTMDDVMGDEDEEEETEQVVNQVLDELGVGIGQEMSSVPASKVPEAAAVTADSDLQARLDNLRRS